MKQVNPVLAARVPPGQVLTAKWPVLTYGATPGFNPRTWTFRCFGLVEREVVWTWPEFLALPRVRRTSDVHCVTRWSRLDNEWEGVSIREIMRHVTPRPEAAFVMQHADPDYTTNIGLADLIADDVILALKHNGRDLEPDHGGPMRLVVPKLYFWKSAKWLRALEFLDVNPPGFWEQNGYHLRGDPWKDERYADQETRAMQQMRVECRARTVDVGGPGMGHDHRGAAARSRQALGTALALSSAVLVVEIVGALWTGSLALAADAGHVFADVAGLGLALFASWIAGRPPTPAKTYGYQRAEILAALLNSLLLMGLAAIILYEAYQRVAAPHAVPGGPLLVIGALGLGANALGVWLLRHAAQTSLNVRAAYLEVLGDALGSVGVLVAAVVIMATGWTPIDSVVSVVIGLFIVVRTWRLLAQVVNVLLEGTPPHLNVVEIETAMREVAGVRRVHELHVWTLTSGREAMSAHVVVDDMGESDRLLEELHAVLHARFGVDHTTIQLEREPQAPLQIKARVGGGAAAER